MGQKSPLKKRHAPLLLGYMRISTADGLQVLDRQRDTLIAAGVAKIYSDTASGKKEDSQGLEACLKAVRDGDTLVVCGPERLCRNSRHVVDLVNTLMERGVHLRVILADALRGDKGSDRHRSQSPGDQGAAVQRSWLLMLLNVLFSLVPRPLTATMMATEMPGRLRP